MDSHPSSLTATARDPKPESSVPSPCPLEGSKSSRPRHKARGAAENRGTVTEIQDAPTSAVSRSSMPTDNISGSHDHPAALQATALPTALVPQTSKRKPPLRPGFGGVGRPIRLRANRFKVSLSDKLDTIYHYDVKFEPSDLKPAKISWKIIETWSEKYRKDLGGIRPVFDGKANLYTARRLPHKQASYTVSLKIGPNDKEEKQFKVTVGLANNILVQDLNDALAGRIQSCPAVIIQALDIVMRMTARVTLTTVGRSVFRSGERQSLGQGRELWFGYYQSVRPNMWAVDLTVDVSATVFYEEKPIVEFMRETLNLRDANDWRDPRDRERFLGEIKGLRVIPTHLSYERKYTVIDVTMESSDRLSFPLDQEDGSTIQCTVAKYFKDKYEINLRYPRLPCLQVAPKEKKRFFPMQVCKLAPGQRCIKKLNEKLVSAMIKKTACPPARREEKIREIVSTANFNRDPYLQEFGITVSPRMCELQGRVLPPPDLQYGESVVTPTGGAWDLRGVRFLKGIEVRYWALLCFASDFGRGGRQGGGRGGRQGGGRGGRQGGGREGRDGDQCCCINFSKQLQRNSKALAMPFRGNPIFHQHGDNERQLEGLFHRIFQEPNRIELVVAILPEGYQGKDIYNELKRLGDLVHEIPTQCVQQRIAQDSKPQVLANICLKINAKVGGVNNAIVSHLRCPVFKQDEPVIFLGADVTHPSPQGLRSDKGQPSIAAVVGSIDNLMCRYACQVRCQKHRQEIIAELQTMVRALLIEYKEKTHSQPTRIIFYRDGVSEGQFQQVLEEELRAIQLACSSLNKSYRPGITMIIVQKRHHTRLFPVNDRDRCGRSGNIPPGTVVDKTIVHPTEFDFFLCSHAGIQGTSRPTHYHVLWDDNKFTADSLQALTYQLCHVYVRCSRSVSLPAPVYYAHLAAYRARCYPDQTRDGSDGKYSTMKMMYFT